MLRNQSWLVPFAVINLISGNSYAAETNDFQISPKIAADAHQYDLQWTKCYFTFDCPQGKSFLYDQWSTQ